VTIASALSIFMAACWRRRSRLEPRTEVTAATLNEIRYELDRLGTTAISAEELESAKRYVCGRFLLDNQLGSALAGTLATSWVNGLPPDTLGEFVSRVKAVPLADVNRVVRSLLPFRRQVVLVVGDGARMKQELEQLEQVTGGAALVLFPESARPLLDGNFQRSFHFRRLLAAYGSFRTEGFPRSGEPGSFWLETSGDVLGSPPIAKPPQESAL
jgi:hypothetical protein